jgi:internalin A
LDISNTQIVDIPEVWDNINLKVFKASKTNIENFYFLSNSIKLNTFVINNSNAINLDFIRQFKDLKDLKIGKTKIKNFDFLQSLTELESLTAYETKINENNFKNLSKLKRLDIHFTGIKNLSFITKIENLQILNTGGCIIREPPKEILEKGIFAIQNFFKQIDNQGGSVELYEAKLILVGEGGTGKTTLFEKLKDNSHEVGNTPETHGINIHEGLPFTII